MKIKVVVFIFFHCHNDQSAIYIIINNSTVRNIFRYLFFHMTIFSGPIVGMYIKGMFIYPTDHLEASQACYTTKNIWRFFCDLATRSS